MKKQHTFILIRVALSVLLLGLLFVVIDRETLLSTISSVDPLYYLCGLAVYFAMMGFWALRWYLFIRAAGEPVGYGRTAGTLLIGMFYAMFLPTIVGTDVGRMYELTRDTSSNKSHVVSTVLLDRLMGMISLVAMALLALLIGYQFAGADGVVTTVVVVLVTLVAGWIIFFNHRMMDWVFDLVFKAPVLKRLEDTIRDIYAVLFQLHNQPRLLISTGIVSLLNSISETLAAMLIARALGIEIEPIYFFIFMPLIWLILTIPISISGLGLREGAFVFFFTQVGVASADAVAISLLLFSYSVVAGVLGGVILLRISIVEMVHRMANTPG